MLKQKIKNNEKLFKVVKRTRNRMSVLIPSSVFLKRQYAKRTGKKLNLKNPQTFNEKLQWLKINWKHENCTICADKFEVRKFVEERIGKKPLVELYNTYSKTSEIDVNQLPNSFVLKVTHGSGQNILCKDKTKIDWEKERKKLDFYLSDNLYYGGREWGYKNITPRIICEKYLEENGEPPTDYKFFCFNGKPAIIQVDLGRSQIHRRDLFDTNWNLLELKYEYVNSSPQAISKKPSQLNVMMEYARKLSDGFPFVRVDFYQIDDCVYFGEMTFYPENGMGKFTPEEFDLKLGNSLVLPEKI